MRGLIITASSVVVLSGCGARNLRRKRKASDTPAPSATTSTPTQPTYVESDACREDAQPALDIVALALTD